MGVSDESTPEAESIGGADSSPEAVDVTGGADVNGSCSSLLAKRVFRSDTVRRFMSSSFEVPTAVVASIESSFDGDPGRFTSSNL